MRTWHDWETVHQPFELQYHIEHGIGWCEGLERFYGFWGSVFGFVGRGGEELDVGCGPRPPCGPGSTAIDPLADTYCKLRPEWWEGVETYAQPAEQLIPDLTGRFDTVLCWNCLDHTIGWRQILTNLAAYGKDDATIAIATDFNPPSIGHPGFDRDEFFRELEERFRIVKQAENFQERDVALVLCVRQ